MNDPEVFLDPCAICRRRKATRLCDYVVEYRRNVIFVCGGTHKQAMEANRDLDDTCDLPLCDQCTNELNGADFCPHHFALLPLAKLPERLEQIRRKQKRKLYEDNP